MRADPRQLLRRKDVEPEVAPQRRLQPLRFRVQHHQGGERTSTAQRSTVTGAAAGGIGLESKQGGRGTGRAEAIDPAAFDEVIGVVTQ